MIEPEEHLNRQVHKSETMDSPRSPNAHKTVGLAGLVGLIYFNVSGGPFASEEIVKAAGPLWALIGLIVVPIIWSIPEALITAELSTLMPQDGGFVLWVERAFGPFAGFMEGWLKWISGVVDNALYPVFIVQYLVALLGTIKGEDVISSIEKVENPKGHSIWNTNGDPWSSEWIMLLLLRILITFMLTYINYRGLDTVGSSAVLLICIGLFPFVLLVFIGAPSVDVNRWVQVQSKIDWGPFLQIMLWSLNYWDSVSTLMGEVVNPNKILPKALSLTMIIVVSSYLFPILVSTGVSPGIQGNPSVGDWDSWNTGYYAYIAKHIGGSWLAVLLVIGSLGSNIGLFIVEMAGDTFQLYGMGQEGMLPSVYAVPSKYGTPTASILTCMTIISILQMFSFEAILEVDNFCYIIAELLIFASVFPIETNPRPFQIPGGNIVLIIMVVPASVLLIVTMTMMDFTTHAAGVVVLLFGVFLYHILNRLKERNTLRARMYDIFEDSSLVGVDGVDVEMTSKE